MELYKDYIKEREGLDIIYTDYSFCTYEKLGEYVYIVDIYVKPEHRKKDEGTKLMNQVIDLSPECKYMLGSYNTATNNWQDSKKVLESRGFKYFKEDSKNNMVYLVKEIR